MTSNEQSNPPPADAKIFKLPPSYRWGLLLAAIFFSGAVALGLALPWLPGNGAFSFVLSAVCLLFFGSLAFYAFRAFQRSRDRVAVNDDGIWYLPNTAGSPTFIRWNEVTTVRARELLQRLEVIDITGRKIRLEFQLENFDRLREIVLSHTEDRRRQTPSLSVFHSGYRTIAIPVFGMLFFLGFACLSMWQGSQGAALLLAGIVILNAYLLARQPLRVRISSQSIIVEYPGWRRAVPFDSIKDVAIANAQNGTPVVTIERQQGKPLIFRIFREGSVALYDAVRGAWLRAQGGSVPSEASEQPGHTSLPDSALPTVFHVTRRALLVLVLITLLDVAGVLYWHSHLSGGRGNPMAVFLLCFALWTIYAMTRIPRSLMLSPDSLTVGYLGWRRIVPFETITNVEMSKRVVNTGKSVDLVTVERRNGRALKFGSLKEGVPTFHQALRAAWSRSIGTPLATDSAKQVTK